MKTYIHAVIAALVFSTSVLAQTAAPAAQKKEAPPASVVTPSAQKKEAPPVAPLAQKKEAPQFQSIWAWMTRQ